MAAVLPAHIRFGSVCAQFHRGVAIAATADRCQIGASFQGLAIGGLRVQVNAGDGAGQQVADRALTDDIFHCRFPFLLSVPLEAGEF